MSASISIIQLGKKCMCTYIGDETDLSRMFTFAGLNDETIAEAITRAAIEIDIKKQVDRELIQMTQK